MADEVVPARLNHLLSDCFTTRDGGSWDAGKIAWAFGIFAFLGLESWNVVVAKNAFDMQAFGIGFGAVLAAGGAALALKAKTEPGGEG